MDKKPFDLQKALAGEKVVTRDGREVTQLVKFDAPKSVYSISGVFDGQVTTWTIDGAYLSNTGDSSNDLFMAPKKVTVWVNAYNNDGIVGVNGNYKSQEQAERYGKTWNNFIGAYPIEVEL